MHTLYVKLNENDTVKLCIKFEDTTLGKGRNFHKPRPLSSSGRGGKKLDLSEMNSGPDIIKNNKLSSDFNNDSLTVKKVVPELKKENPRMIHVSSEPIIENIDSLIKRERKSSIKDILEVDASESRPKSSVGRPKSNRRQQDKEPVTYSIEDSSILQRPPTRGGLERTSSSSSLKSAKSLTSKVGPAMPSSRPIQNLTDARPITLQTAINLKSVVFGTGNQNFNDEWRISKFSICDIPKLQYGLVQKKGGSCGVMAAIQATVLQTLLFKDGRIPLNRFGEPTSIERSTALAIALAKIFWRCGEYKTAVVVMPSGKSQFQGSSNKYKYDDLTETVSLDTILSDLDTMLSKYLHRNVHSKSGLDTMLSKYLHTNVHSKSGLDTILSDLDTILSKYLHRNVHSKSGLDTILSDLDTILSKYLHRNVHSNSGLDTMLCKYLHRNVHSNSSLDTILSDLDTILSDLDTILSKYLHRNVHSNSGLDTILSKYLHTNVHSNSGLDTMLSKYLHRNFHCKSGLETTLHCIYKIFGMRWNGGAILCVYSAILSRYIDLVKSDMDEPTGKLMGAHGYCTQMDRCPGRLEWNRTFVMMNQFNTDYVGSKKKEVNL
ncbi:MINDY3_4 [Mytilus edulis]|uniref:Ubiquitin carboxyl-terminal hydrolase MINDY n=1 Tax=Mytilus edulis TaxID=6550 RepID=A0A8S3UZ78_MYTED|nr:MINDY3_4 [Mytilus edulis]